jgi:hypothetical protein
MHQVSRPNDASGEAGPDFPTREEIELAEQLRRKLEERYLGQSAPPSAVPKGSAEDR